ncbi:MAG TPA: bifunctional serine/threonine-protein kinase/formylglycine-generating enzyme family protein [Bryobacteraceae bacterium]|nr:bifunctional serine/threonine-protein kinase/formylglycine-generating enzyme family protein [Bryobacteraceae bacterium]
MDDIGRYRILGELGSGGMGVVFRAYDPVLGRQVAIKTLKLSDFSNPSERDALRDRLAREARAAAALSHAGIVTIHDVVQQGDLISLVMERIEGQTLADLLSAAPLDLTAALRIIRETAAALDYAHRKGIVHRDIKPANIMLDETGAVKVADFGIAKITTSQTRTESAGGFIVGTAGYMAPEQLRGAPVDGKTDQFSLAVVAYEMLAHRRPFVADSMIALTHQVVFEEAPTLSTLRPGFGPAVDAVFQKALSKSPANRYPTCSAFAADLEAKVNAAVNQATLAYPSIPRKPSSKRAWWAAAAAILLAIAGAAATYFVLHKREPPSVKQTPVTFAKAAPPIEQSRPTPPPPSPTLAPTPVPLEKAPVVVKPGAIRVNKKDGQKYVWIPPGAFTMGCVPDDATCGGYAKPPHRVTISNGFWMAQNITTVAAYKAFAEATHRDMPKAPKFNPNWTLLDHPMVEVNWDDAVAFSAWAGARLPTEAEWEYAARGGTGETVFPWGNDASHELANFGEGTGGTDEQGAKEGKDQWLYTSPVASFAPNAFNLYDMAGNASQWCSDWFSPGYYAKSPEKDPPGAETGKLKITRGGSWKSPARFLHTSFRGARAPEERGLTSGFRCVLK